MNSGILLARDFCGLVACGDQKRPVGGGANQSRRAPNTAFIHRSAIHWAIEAELSCRSTHLPRRKAGRKPSSGALRTAHDDGDTLQVGVRSTRRCGRPRTSLVHHHLGVHTEVFLRRSPHYSWKGGDRQQPQDPPSRPSPVAHDRPRIGPTSTAFFTPTRTSTCAPARWSPTPLFIARNNRMVSIIAPCGWISPVGRSRFHQRLFPCGDREPSRLVAGAS